MLRADKDHLIDAVVTTINVCGPGDSFIAAGDGLFKQDVLINGNLVVDGTIDRASHVISSPAPPIVTATNVQGAIDQLAEEIAQNHKQYLEVSDTTGGITIPMVVIDIPFDSQPYNNTNYTHIPGTPGIVFNVAGTYKVCYKATTEITSGFLRTNAEFELQLDAGGGFAPVPNSGSNVTNRTTGSGPATITSTNYVTVGVGDELKLVAEKTVGTSTVRMVAGKTNIVINKMD
jgi:hypothetical protein